MPVRLLTSSILKWPKDKQIHEFFSNWAKTIKKQKPTIVKIGYFGPYARGDAGVGSDLDLIVVIKDSQLPFEKRAAEWDFTTFPVPTDVFIYTEAE